MRKTLALVAALVAALSLALSSVAATSTAVSVTGTVSGAGALSVSSGATASFSSALDGTDNAATFSIPLTVTDARGTNAGWNITVAATAFTDGASHALPPATVTGVSSTCLSTCSGLGNTITYPVTTSATAVKFISTASGRGKFTITPAFSVSVTADSFAGSYTSTYTFASISGP